MLSGVLDMDHFAALLVTFGSMSVLAVLTWRGYPIYSRLVRSKSHVRFALFVAGLGITVGAFFGPLPDLGHQYFFVHQTEHLAARLLGPMLIALSRPVGWLAAGLSRKWRSQISSVLRSPVVRAVRSPVAATFLLILSLYIWQLPAIYSYAQATEMLEFAAHLCMVAAGISYFSAVFDPGSIVGSWPYGARLISAFVVIVSNILLGALVTLKEISLYSSAPMAFSAGADLGLSDETIGGYIIWVPSSMVMIATIMFILNGWNRFEEVCWQARNERRGSNSAALEFPETAYELKLKTAGPNRRMGRTLAIGALSMFAMVITTTITVLQLY